MPFGKVIRGLAHECVNLCSIFSWFNGRKMTARKESFREATCSALSRALSRAAFESMVCVYHIRNKFRGATALINQDVKKGSVRRPAQGFVSGFMFGVGDCIPNIFCPGIIFPQFEHLFVLGEVMPCNKLTN